MSLTGTYRLIRHESRFSDGEVQHTYGESPEGLLVYTDSGYYSCQAMKPGVDPVPLGKLPEERNRSAYDDRSMGITGSFGIRTGFFGPVAAAVSLVELLFGTKRSGGAPSHGAGAADKQREYDKLLAAVGGYSGTFGTYTVDEAAGTVTHHIVGAWLPNAVGKDDEIHFEQVERGLVFKGESPIHLPDGRSLITEWTWVRIS